MRNREFLSGSIWKALEATLAANRVKLILLTPGLPEPDWNIDAAGVRRKCWNWRDGTRCQWWKIIFMHG